MKEIKNLFEVCTTHFNSKNNDRKILSKGGPNG